MPSHLPHCEEFAPRDHLATRIVDGLRRRARHWAGRLQHDDPHVALEQAAETLRIHGHNHFGGETPLDLARLPDQADRCTDVARTARLATSHFELQELTLGNRLLRRAYRMWHRQASAHTLCDAWWLLEAARAQVRATFAAGKGGLAEALSSDDSRWLAVRDWAMELAPDALLADIGCGTGRYLAALAESRPDLRLVAIEPDAQSLAQTPHQCARRGGDLLNIPAADGEFDAAYTVEALEHALLPRQAIDELCRSVRSGGPVLIIDKHRALQSLSHHQPWERWFEPAEVVEWLAPWCQQIACRPSPHRGDRTATPLFLCWTAVRR